MFLTDALLRLALAVLGLGLVVSGLWLVFDLEPRIPPLALILAGGLLCLVVLLWSLHSLALLLTLALMR